MPRGCSVVLSVIGGDDKQLSHYAELLRFRDLAISAFHITVGTSGTTPQVRVVWRDLAQEAPLLYEAHQTLQ